MIHYCLHVIYFGCYPQCFFIVSWKKVKVSYNNDTTITMTLSQDANYLFHMNQGYILIKDLFFHSHVWSLFGSYCMAISKASLSWRKWIFLCVCDVLFIVAIIIRHLVQPKQWQIVYVLQATEKKNLISRLKILQRVAPHVVLVVAEVILGLPGSIGKTQVSRQQF